MRSDKQETALDWYDSKIKQLEFQLETAQITWAEYYKEKGRLLGIAKEAEKLNIRWAFFAGTNNKDRKTSKEYHRQTYGGNG
jgi:hypothetical protein